MDTPMDMDIMRTWELCCVEGDLAGAAVRCGSGETGNARRMQITHAQAIRSLLTERKIDEADHLLDAAVDMFETPLWKRMLQEIATARYKVGLAVSPPPPLPPPPHYPLLLTPEEEKAYQENHPDDEEEADTRKRLIIRLQGVPADGPTTAMTGEQALTALELMDDCIAARVMCIDVCMKYIKKQRWDHVKVLRQSSLLNPEDQNEMDKAIVERLEEGTAQPDDELHMSNGTGTIERAEQKPEVDMNLSIRPGSPLATDTTEPQRSTAEGIPLSEEEKSIELPTQPVDRDEQKARPVILLEATRDESGTQKQPAFDLNGLLGTLPDLKKRSRSLLTLLGGQPNTLCDRDALMFSLKTSWSSVRGIVSEMNKCLKQISASAFIDAVTGKGYMLRAPLPVDIHIWENLSWEQRKLLNGMATHKGRIWKTTELRAIWGNGEENAHTDSGLRALMSPLMHRCPYVFNIDREGYYFDPDTAIPPDLLRSLSFNATVILKTLLYGIDTWINRDLLEEAMSTAGATMGNGEGQFTDALRELHRTLGTHGSIQTRWTDIMTKRITDCLLEWQGKRPKRKERIPYTTTPDNTLPVVVRIGRVAKAPPI